MLRSNSRTFVLATMLCASCGNSDETLAPTPPLVPVVPPPAGVATRLELVVDTRSVFVGMQLRAQVRAYDERGQRVSSEAATVTSSNSLVVQLNGAEFVNVYYPGSGIPTRERVEHLSLVGAGTAVLRVTLEGVSDSAVIPVRALPLASQALAVDTFTVIEYQVVCAFDCPYLAYAPLLKLRESTGSSVADVVAVEFSVPTRTTGWCSGQQRFANGLSAHINGIDDYLWANDLIFVSLNGVPLPDGPAKARVIVRDSTGEYGMLEVTAPIQRMVHHARAILPAPTGNGWGCSYP